VLLDALNGLGDDVAPVDGAERLDIGRLDQVLERPGHIEGHRGAAAADNGAGKTLRLLGEREQGGAAADVGPDQVRVSEAPLIDQPDEERSHRTWGEQVAPAL
jgi:hypothetical protein